MQPTFDDVLNHVLEIASVRLCIARRRIGPEHFSDRVGPKFFTDGGMEFRNMHFKWMYGFIISLRILCEEDSTDPWAVKNRNRLRRITPEELFAVMGSCHLSWYSWLLYKSSISPDERWSGDALREVESCYLPERRRSSDTATGYQTIRRRDWETFNNLRNNLQYASICGILGYETDNEQDRDNWNGLAIVAAMTDFADDWEERREQLFVGYEKQAEDFLAKQPASREELEELAEQVFLGPLIPREVLAAAAEHFGFELADIQANAALIHDISIATRIWSFCKRADIEITPKQTLTLARHQLVSTRKEYERGVPLTEPEREVAMKLLRLFLQKRVREDGVAWGYEHEQDVLRGVQFGERGLTAAHKLGRASGCFSVLAWATAAVGSSACLVAWGLCLVGR